VCTLQWLGTAHCYYTSLNPLLSFANWRWRYLP
jgi:hypothetical protein